MNEQIKHTMEPWCEEELRAKVGQVRSIWCVVFDGAILCLGMDPARSCFWGLFRHAIQLPDVESLMHASGDEMKL